MYAAQGRLGIVRLTKWVLKAIVKCTITRGCPVSVVFWFRMIDLPLPHRPIHLKINETTERVTWFIIKITSAFQRVGVCKQTWLFLKSHRHPPGKHKDRWAWHVFFQECIRPPPYIHLGISLEVRNLKCMGPPPYSNYPDKNSGHGNTGIQKERDGVWRGEP